MARHRRRHFALARRYGRFGMADVHSGTQGVRKLARDNPEVTAAAIGGAMGAIAAGMTTPTAALIGALSGVAVQQAVKK